MKSEKTKVTLVVGVEGKEQDFYITSGTPHTRCSCTKGFALESVESAIEAMRNIEKNSMLIPGFPWELTLENAEKVVEKCGRYLEDMYDDAVYEFGVFDDEDSYGNMRKELEKRMPSFITDNQYEVMDEFYYILGQRLATWFSDKIAEILLAWKLDMEYECECEYERR